MMGSLALIQLSMIYLFDIQANQNSVDSQSSDHCESLSYFFSENVS